MTTEITYAEHAMGQHNVLILMMRKGSRYYAEAYPAENGISKSQLEDFNAVAKQKLDECVASYTGREEE